MAATLYDLIQFHAEVPTWFGVGGKADRFAAPQDQAELRDVLLAFAGHHIRIYGDGANLLIADEGVDGLVLSLEHLNAVEIIDDPERPGETVILRAEAGVNLPKLITQTVRDGLQGLEVLAGIPATVGGAVVMNAGGAFGEIAGVVHAVHATSPHGHKKCIPADEIAFDYRTSGLHHLIITAVDFRLTRVSAADQPALRQRLKDVMAYKKDTQPLAQQSAGCCFKNPRLPGMNALTAGEPATSRTRVSAGMLIDEAGCKGMRIGGAEVSHRHANFIVTHPGCTATNILELMEAVAEKVATSSGVTLEPEITIWRRTETKSAGL